MGVCVCRLVPLITPFYCAIIVLRICLFVQGLVEKQSILGHTYKMNLKEVTLIDDA